MALLPGNMAIGHVRYSNSVEQVCKLIEADSLAFLSHEGMLAAGHRDDLCLACFNHKYPTKLY